MEKPLQKRRSPGKTMALKSFPIHSRKTREEEFQLRFKENKAFHRFYMKREEKSKKLLRAHSDWFKIKVVLTKPLKTNSVYHP